MGKLIDGEWKTVWEQESTGGRFVRKPAMFRNWITADGSAGPSGEGGFPAASGRYHIYASFACPWAHRTLIFRALKGLTDHISISIVHPEMLTEGWTFSTEFDGATGDTLTGHTYLREVYQASDPHMTGRVTVPILWDKQRQTIVSNESAEIIRMFNSAFNDLTGNTDDYCPADLVEEIDAVNHRVYRTFNNGVYKCGFARRQEVYDEVVAELFDTMDWLEDRLSRQRYLMGDRLTEADWRAWVTLLRFDMVYHTHFKCNRKRVVDYPNLWGFTRELYQHPGIVDTVHMDHIVRHYYYSHESINPRRIIPIGPVIDWREPHGRG